MTTRPIVRSALFVFASALGLVSTGGNQVKAYDIITTDPRLPPRDADAAYIAQNPASYPQYGVTLPNPFSVGDFTNIIVTDSGQNELASFDATFLGQREHPWCARSLHAHRAPERDHLQQRRSDHGNIR